MAQKRMFDKAIIDTDRFMDLSMATKAFYFLLGMEADDEGFVSYKKVMRIHGGNEDDFRVLVLKNFLISFESGVVVITDWNSNNWLDSRRTRPTEYQKEKKLIFLNKDNKYMLSNGLASIEEYRGEEKSIEQNNLFDVFWNNYPRKTAKTLAEKSFSKLKVDSSLLDKMLVALDVQKSSSQWTRDQGSYVPHPSTWLNQRRWEDEIKPERIKSIIDLN